MTLTDWLVSILGILVIAVTLLCRPHHARCPAGWWLDGVRPSGRYDCRRVPIGDDRRDADGIVRDHSYEPPGEIDGEIYCTGGSKPIVVDERTVGCQRGGWP
ncbi:MAG TPA: hypothetical protein VGG74_21170 [Kofleriaceae bacterium]|jgi:hypothetical protein